MQIKSRVFIIPGLKQPCNKIFQYEGNFLFILKEDLLVSLQSSITPKSNPYPQINKEAGIKYDNLLCEIKA